MTSMQLAGLGLAIVAGLAAGFSAAPMKWMRNYGFEHWALVSALTGLLILPWGLAAALCPGLGEALAAVPWTVYLKANAWSLAWGVANVLAGLCLMRIGFSLTIGLLTGVGLPVGVLLPMLLKGSGQFAEAPSLFSRTGAAMAVLTLLLLAATVLMTRAGFEREKSQPKRPAGSGFKLGLVLSIVAGFCQVGLSFAFVYSQGPLMAALQTQGASDSGAIAAVWAVTLPGGLLVNLAYPLWLMRRRKSFAVLFHAPDFLLSLAIGGLYATLMLSMGNGMRLLGPLGASLGFGIYQTFQILASQGVGVISGEWRNTSLRARLAMTLAVTLTLAGAAGMAIVK